MACEGHTAVSQLGSRRGRRGSLRGDVEIMMVELFLGRCRISRKSRYYAAVRQEFQPLRSVPSSPTKARDATTDDLIRTAEVVSRGGSGSTLWSVR